MTASPRVVLVDLDHWDAFASFAPSLRRRGVRVVRIAGPRGRRHPALARVVDRMVFGRPGPTVDARTSAADAVRLVIGAPTVDVLGAEGDIETLRETVPWSEHPVAARVPDPAHVRLLFDKLAMTRFADTIPVPTPRTWEQAPGDVLPLVVKGLSGAGGQAVRIARTSRGVEAAVSELAPVVSRGLFYQELCEGVLTNVGGVADRGRIVTSCCYRAIPADDDPLGPPEVVELVECSAITDSLAPLLEALSYSGMFCIDYIVRPDGSAALIDFNPRIFGGWLALQTAGVDLLGAYLSLLGLAPTPPPTPPSIGVRRDVRLIPRSGARTWREWGARMLHSVRQFQRVTPVTGAGFGAAMGLRALRVSARDAAVLGRRTSSGRR